MKHKERVIKFIKALVFCMLLTFMIHYSAGIMERKVSIETMGALFKDKDDIDVLFFGTSHVRYSILPMELWNDYGITSHNIGGSYATQAESYWTLKNILDYMEPELVVLDCYKIAEEDKAPGTGSLHMQMDYIPTSVNKIRMVNDLMDNLDDKMQFIWKFSLYHSRWSELTASDFYKRESLINELDRGSTPMGDKVAEPVSYPKLDRAEKMNDTDTTGLEYLCKSIEECQSRGIDVMLAYIPFPADEEKQREANTSYDIAREYGINYVNFLDLDVVNYNTDCRDKDAHLNTSGAYKLTNYIGNYIIKNYNIEDHRKDTAYESWNDNYEEYIKSKIDTIHSQANLDCYLMLLSDRNLSSCIYIDETSVIFQNEKMVELLKNVSQYKALEKLEEAAATGSSYFFIVDNSEHTVYESVNGQEFDIPNTTVGHIVYGMDSEGKPYLYIQDKEENFLDTQHDVTMIVFNKYTGSIEDTAHFTTYGKDNYGIKAE